MRSNLVSLSLGFVFVLAACGDDSGGSDERVDAGGNRDGAGGVDAVPNPCVDNGGADCFELPSAPISIPFVSDGGLEAPANLACAPPTPTQSETNVAISGTTTEITSGAAVPNVPVAFYYDLFGTPAAMGTSNASGALSVTLPQPVPSALNVKITRDGDFANYGFHVVLDVSDGTIAGVTFPSAGRDATELVANILGEDFDDTKGYAAATVLDCDGVMMSHLVGTLSSTSSTGTNAAPTFVPGAAVYYFGSGSIPLPVPRTDRTETNANGGFLITRIPPTPTSSQVYLQAWGFPNAEAMAMGQAGLVLVAELPVTIFADSLHGAFMDPTEGP